MDLKLFYKLGTQSKRAIKRTHKRGGHPYTYRPRITLCQRLADETGLTVSQVRRQLLKEREFILKHLQYFR